MRVQETLAMGFEEDEDYIYRWVDSTMPGRVMELSNAGYEPLDPLTGDPVEALDESGEWPARVLRGNMLLMRAKAEDRAGNSTHPKAQAVVNKRAAEQVERPSEDEQRERHREREEGHREMAKKVEEATKKQRENPTPREQKQKQDATPKPDSKPVNQPQAGEVKRG